VKVLDAPKVNFVVNDIELFPIKIEESKLKATAYSWVKWFKYDYEKRRILKYSDKVILSIK